MTKETIVQAVTNKLAGKDLTAQAVQILKSAATTLSGRAKQELDLKLRENPAALIEGFSKKIASRIADAAQIYTNSCGDLALIPDGTRFIRRDKDYTTFIVEQAPAIRNILISTENDNTPRNYFLALPYVQFIFTVSNGGIAVQATATKKPLKTLDDVVYEFPLPNVQNTNVCAGHMARVVGETPSEKIKSFMNNFWQSQFNHDYSDGFRRFISSNRMMLPEWERKSRENQLFILSAKFAGCTAPSTGQNVANIRSLLPKSGQAQQTLEANVKKELISAISSIGSNVQDILSSVHIDTANSNHAESLQLILKELIIQAYSELWDYLQKQLKEEKDLLLRQKENLEKKNRESEEKLRELISRITALASAAGNGPLPNMSHEQFMGKPSYKKYSNSSYYEETGHPDGW